MKQFPIFMLIFAFMATAIGCDDSSSVVINSPSDGTESDDPDEGKVTDDKKCPKGSLKKYPGICGCDIEDVDENDNDIMDCLETDEKTDSKLCPDGSKKGVCGCEPETDTNGNTVPDCLEDDLNDNDECPEGSVSKTQGLCGCNIIDTPENTKDSDNDGVIDCLDDCPNDPSITKLDSSMTQCPSNTPSNPSSKDSDNDTIPDDQDACPNNPDITDPIIEGVDIDCNPDNSKIIEIKKAEDFETLRTTLAQLQNTPTDAQPCNTEDETQCQSDTTALRCHNRIWRSISCGSCSSNQCNSPANHYDVPQKVYIVRVMNDINLADYYETTDSGNGSCSAVKWDPIPYVNNIRFEAVKGAVISFTKNGVRCALPSALIHLAMLSQFSNLTLDFDMNQSAQASLLNEADSTILTNVVYKGTITTAATENVGGIVALTASTQDDANNEAIRTTLTGVVCDGATINAEKATNVGGIVGTLSDADLSTGSATHKVTQIKGYRNVGGIVGKMSAEYDHSKLENIQSNVGTVECLKTYCGGAIGVANGAGAINQVTSTLGTINAKEIEYVAGFAGGLIPEEGEITISKVTNNTTSVNVPNGTYIAGFVAYTNEKASFNTITNKVTNILGDYFTGGFVASSLGAKFSNIKNEITELKAQNSSMEAAFEGGFAAEIRGGSLEQVVSIIPSVINASAGSKLSEDVDSVAGFIATTSDAVTLSNILSWTNTYSNQTEATGFIGRQETAWQTSNTTHMTLNNVVSLSKVFQYTNTSDVQGSATESASRAISGNELTAYTANNAYFYKRGTTANALANSDGSFKSITDSDKASAISALSAAWSGWKSGSLTLGSESVSDFPTFDAGNP